MVGMDPGLRRDGEFGWCPSLIRHGRAWTRPSPDSGSRPLIGLRPLIMKAWSAASFWPHLQNAKPRQGGQPGFRVPSSRTELACTAEVGETDGEPLFCILSTLGAMAISRINYQIEVMARRLPQLTDSRSPPAISASCPPFPRTS